MGVPDRRRSRHESAASAASGADPRGDGEVLARWRLGDEECDTAVLQVCWHASTHLFRGPSLVIAGLVQMSELRPARGVPERRERSLSKP